MSEEASRLVGAGAGTSEIKIGGKACVPRPLTIKELGEIERECLKRYRRSYMEGFVENADFLPDDVRQKRIEEKIEEVARWGLADLPTRRAYDPTKIVVTKALEDWATQTYGPEVGAEKAKERRHELIQRLAVTSLDNETMTHDQFQKLTGKQPYSQKVSYANWWVAATFEGQIEMLYTVFKHNNITREELFDAIASNPAMIIDAVREIEHLTAPKLGNQ